MGIDLSKFGRSVGRAERYTREIDRQIKISDASRISEHWAAPIYGSRSYFKAKAELDKAARYLKTDRQRAKYEKATQKLDGAGDRLTKKLIERAGEYKGKAEECRRTGDKMASDPYEDPLRTMLVSMLPHAARAAEIPAGGGDDTAKKPNRKSVYAGVVVDREGAGINIDLIPGNVGAETAENKGHEAFAYANAARDYLASTGRKKEINPGVAGSYANAGLRLSIAQDLLTAAKNVASLQGKEDVVRNMADEQERIAGVRAELEQKIKKIERR